MQGENLFIKGGVTTNKHGIVLWIIHSLTFFQENTA
jgi:hypothetical protein